MPKICPQVSRETISNKEGRHLMNTTFSELLNSYMKEKHIDEIKLTHKCHISPMYIVNIKKGSHTYSKQLVEKLGHGLELGGDEIVGFLGATGFLIKNIL